MIFLLPHNTATCLSLSDSSSHSRFAQDDRILGAVKLLKLGGDTQAEAIHKIQQGFSDDVIGVTQIKEWLNRSKMVTCR
jgi:hypothetical protein